MRIETEKFGKLEADPATFINFSAGLYGFPEARNFLLIDSNGGGDFRWLQSVELPALAFLVTDPGLFYPEYRQAAERADDLLLSAPDDHLVLATVTVNRATRGISVNLAAPVIINEPRREGRQIILSQEQGYGTDHDLIRDLKQRLEPACKGAF